MIGGRRERDPLSDELAALDELQADARRPVRRPTALIVPILITMIVMTGGVTIAWYSYNAGVKEGSEGAAPLLKPSGPMKVAPDNPGGTPIPHKDITVYQSLSENDDAERKVERILPPPERPLTPPTAAPTDNSRVRSADTLPGATPQVEPPTTGTPPAAPGAPSARSLIPPSLPPAASPSGPAKGQQLALAAPKAEKPATAQPVEKEIRTAPVKPAPTPDAPAARVPAASPQVAAIPSGAFKVQIGSVSSEDQAPRMWSIQKEKSGNLLASLSMNVEKTVIKGKAYYRVQAGPLKDAASARTLCDQLKQRQIGCFVVFPKK